MWFLSLTTAIALAGQSPEEVVECEPLSGWEALSERSSGKYLVLGESHGSVEAPAAVAEYICAIAGQGPILLGIEFSSADNDGLQRAWGAPHSQFRERMFAELPVWGTRPDGVASAAMLTMLEKLHALKEAGRQIDIVAFNGAKNDAQRAAFKQLPGQEPHEAAQAANIREAAQSREYTHVIVLVGRFHAGKRSSAPAGVDGIETRPMAMLLAPPDRVVSLAMNSAGGETWSCRLRPDFELDATKPIPGDAIVCGANSIGPDNQVLSRGFHLDTPDRTSRFDGVFALGAITASPPPEID